MLSMLKRDKGEVVRSKWWLEGGGDRGCGVVGVGEEWEGGKGFEGEGGITLVLQGR